MQPLSRLLFQLTLAASAATAAPLPAAEPATTPKAASRPFAQVNLPNPRALAIDATGNLYVVDIDLAAIVKITPGGSASPLATTGIASPFAVAVSRAGEVFVSDTDNNFVYRLNARGAAAVAGGSGPGGFAGLTSLTVDTAGNVFVTDNGNAVVRKITPQGVASVFAGKVGEQGARDGPAANARFMTPRGIAVDAAGNLYVADEGNSNIRKITPAGAVTTLAGSAGNSGSENGTGTAARFAAPRALAVDAAGNVYVADTDNHTIRQVTPAGAVTTLAGLAGAAGNTDGPGDNARFSEPRGVAVDATGNVFVADTGNAAVRQITPARAVSTVAAEQPR